MAAATSTRAVTPAFTLVAVVSTDGFIGRYSGHDPPAWASAEEQIHFAALVDAADWSFMGRVTHERAPRASRRRVVFSRREERPRWANPNQLFVDPERTPLERVSELLRPVREPRHCLVLGGTGVHDWFLARSRIDRVVLTTEPVSFGAGLPLFTDQPIAGPVSLLEDRGFVRQSMRLLNDRGTRLETYGRAAPAVASP